MLKNFKIFKQHQRLFSSSNRIKTISHESELNLNSALASVNMGSWWIDLKSKHTHMSPSLSALYGIAETEWKDPDFMINLIHPEDRKYFHDNLNLEHKDPSTSYLEFRIVRPDGMIRWHYTRIAYTFDKNGKPLRLNGIQGDRTESKIQSDLLRESEEKYRNLVSDAHDGIIIVGENGNLIFANRQTEDMFGYTQDELINMPAEILVPESLREKHKHQKEEYLKVPNKRSMGKLGFELNGRRKDGSEFAIDIGLSPSVSKNEKITTAIIRDISERKKREQQLLFLASASHVLAESFENSDMIKKLADLVILRLADGCSVRLIGEDEKLHAKIVAFRNPEKQEIAERFTNLLEEKGLIPNQIREALKNNTVQLVTNYSDIYLEDSTIDNSELYIKYFSNYNAAYIPLLINEKKIGVLSIIIDKTKWCLNEKDVDFLKAIGLQVALSVRNIRLYNEAQKAIKLREDILAIVSHDLRNPLFLIQMSGEVLPKIVNDQTKILSFSEKILRSTEQMKRMIEDLMDFAKIQEGNLSIELKLEDPNAIILLVYEMLKVQADKKGVKLSTVVDSEIPHIKFDRLRMIQAFSNLAGNAVKFTNNGGSVVLSTFKSGDKIRFSVKDTGEGISEEELPKIFDRYWQSKKTRTASAGLGLSITRGIIEAHGSKILVESKRGEGSTFSFDMLL